MELSLFLAKIFGIYMLIVGVSVVARQKTIMFVVRDMVKSALFTYSVGILELVLGLLVVMTHNVWVAGWEALITIFGWLMVLEGAFYLLAPQDVIKRWAKMFNQKSVYVAGGLISIILGAYLAYIGFLA